MITWDDLRYILAVHRHGSLGGAAKALGQNKSTVGRRVSALEADLGTSLLTRSSTGYELTEAGLKVVAAATHVERQVNELAAAVGGHDLTQSGTVRVTVPAFFAQHVIIPALPELREHCPGLDVHLITTDDVLNLARREADIALRNVRPEQQSLVAVRAGAIAFAMYGSRDYIDRRGLPADRSDLDGHDFIAYEQAVAHVAAYRWVNDVAGSIAFRAKDAVSMLDAVVAGLGLGVLPCFLCDGVADLVCLETVGGRQPEDIWLVTHPDTRKVVRVRVVVDWLKEIFERNAARLAPPP